MSTSSRPDLIGFAGTFVGGKDTLATHLQHEFGYSHVSTGDMVREIAQKERGTIERPVLREVANEHRHRLGAGAFVLFALKKPRPLIISGLRSLGEAKALKAAGGVLMFIDAPIEIRYQRMLARKRDGEVKKSFEEFKMSEQAEWHSGNDDADFNLRDIKLLADVNYENTTDDIETFFIQAKSALGIS